MRVLVATLIVLTISGCTSVKSIMGFHPGVLKNEDGTTKAYDAENLTFLDHKDSFWHQLLLVKEGESQFAPEILVENFLAVVIDDQRFVEINEFDRRRVNELMVEKTKKKKEELITHFENGIFVLEGYASFYGFNFEKNQYQLQKIDFRDGTQIYDANAPDSYGKKQGFSSYVNPEPTPPIVDPVDSRVLLNHSKVRTTDIFLSRLSVTPSNISFRHDSTEAEELKPFYSDPRLKVSIVSEMVDYSDRPVAGVPGTSSSKLNNDQYLVFEHNVLCYIFFNGEQFRYKFFENSDFDNRSKEICQAEVDRLKTKKPLESANMRPSFDDFPDGSLTARGERARFSLEDYF